jgi:hypothetical protein
VGDLLTSALADIDQALPVHEGQPIYDHDSGGEVPTSTGPRIEFQALANQYFEEIERELGNESPKPLYT